MKTALYLFAAIYVTTVAAQDVVQVMCAQDSITAKIQKEVVRTAGFEMQNVHMNDNECQFNQEDDDFFIRTISPITSCGTHVLANDTHVEFTNSLSTVDTGPTWPYGVVVGAAGNPRVLSALISCIYRIDLNVSVMFIPNITIIPIKIPDAFGTGEFRAAMAIYTDGTYRKPYLSPPTMAAEATLYVGVTLVGASSPDIFLLMEECWGTTTSDPTASPKYPLIEDGCAVSTAADGAVRVRQNGVGDQAMWNSPIFKFVGDGEAYDNVWLHCDLQLCIKRQCEPTCSNRKRRAVDETGTFWGPRDFNEEHIITMGPITRIRITEIARNQTKVVYVDVEPENYVPIKSVVVSPETSDSMIGTWNPAVVAVVGVLGGLALICVMLALVAIIVRMYARSSNGGFDLTGIENKSYAA